MLTAPTILALDFDGVICDGLIEYFQTTKRTYEQLWQDKPVPDGLEPSFYRLRPVIETGWEMPILLRALVLGVSEDEILQHWSAVCQSIVQREALDAREIGSKLDRTRDRWIETDLDEWLKLHHFYPGVLDRIHKILESTGLYIVTTKEGRFVQQLLQQQNLELADHHIIGKESQRPKHQTLREIIASAGDAQVWFVEDRLKTLQQVQQQADLQQVRLFLAAWGYNTAQARNSVSELGIRLLTLEQFNQDFSAWI